MYRQLYILLYRPGPESMRLAEVYENILVCNVVNAAGSAPYAFQGGSQLSALPTHLLINC